MADDCAPYVTQDGYDSGLIVLCADAGHNTPILTESWRGNGVNVHQTYQLPLDDAAAVAGWSDADIDKFLHSVAPEGPGANPNPADEWAGMPEFRQGKEVEPFRKITVSFDSQADVDEFQKLLGISVGNQSFTWFPPKKPEKLGDFEYVKD